tara:strand:- start:227 stop:421 length:195 start_codon:yes stop_codon:yes gene_type:complete
MVRLSKKKPKKKAQDNNKKELKIAKGLKEVYPGIAGNDSTLKMLKRLGIDPKDLVNEKYKSYGK